MKGKLLVIFLIVPLTLFAGKFGITGKVSMYDPPGESGPTLMIGVEASYKLSEYLDAVGAIEWTRYEEAGEDVTLIPVTLNARFHPLGRGGFDPYFGGGAGYWYREGVNVESTVGLQAIFGISWQPKDGKGISFELRYTMPDINDPNKGGLTYSGGVTGAIELGRQ